MALPRIYTALFFAILANLTGCAPKIGDACVTNQDCSQQADGRLCDTSQPGGYCTMVDCDPTTCPSDESSCVSFAATRSILGLCDNRVLPSPYRRNFCMQICESSSDCRGGYACEDVSGPNELGATLIQEDPESKKICVVASSLPLLEDSGNSDEICTRVNDGLGGAGGAPVE